MSISFEDCIAYEDRDLVRTSRWKLDGIKTTDPGNTAEGWLWFSLSVTDDVAAVKVYKDAAGSSEVARATSVDVSGLDSAAAKASLSQQNSSGITGELYIEEYEEDVELVPLLVSLCVDKHLDIEYNALANLPSGVYSATTGMADYCAAATGKVLRLVSQLYSGQLGGYGALEHRNLDPAYRLYPDYRKIADPRQLRDAAVHCALSLGLYAAHNMVDDTVYSEQGDRHDDKFKDAISAWNLAIMAAPDTSHDAGETQSASAIRVERI